MTCGCNDAGSGIGGSACARGRLPIRPNCRRVYGGNAADLVDGLELQRQIDALVDHQNDLAALLAEITGPDCTLKDGSVLCRHLASEVGTACLFTGEAPPAPLPPGPVPGGPVLDYPGLNLAYAGWSLRKLKVDYAGPLIRIRRALDNAELDIGAAPNNLVDTAAMIAFSQGSDLFLSRVYEQVGQGPHDLVQATPALQPKIYDSITGFLTNSAGRIGAKFDNVDDYLAGENALLAYSTVGSLSIATEWHEEQNGHLNNFRDKVGGGSMAAANYRRPSGTIQYWDPSWSAGIPDLEVTGRLNEPWLLTWAVKEDGSPLRTEGRLNGSLKVSGSGGFTGSGTCRLTFMCDSAYANVGAGYFQEIVYFLDIDWEEILPDLALPLIQVLEANMMSTWGIVPD